MLVSSHTSHKQPGHPDEPAISRLTISGDKLPSFFHLRGAGPDAFPSYRTLRIQQTSIAEGCSSNRKHEHKPSKGRILR
jgi:hypothetical protein